MSSIVQSEPVGPSYYGVQSGVFLTKFRHGLLLSLSAQPDIV